MTRDLRRCLDPEVIAAFAAGGLSGNEMKEAADHIRECEDCRQVLADVAFVDREIGGQVVAMPQRARWPWWLGVAAAALIVVVSLGIWHPWVEHGSDASLRLLVEAAPPNGRMIEPRLSGGFPWAPMRAHRANSEPLDAAQMKFIGAAGTVIERTEKDASPKARHAAAIAHLVAGRPKEAADLLTALTAAYPNDGRTWSDLAAARYALALQTDDASHLAEALVAADEAVKRAPALPEARFNRALIVDRLGLRDQARDAWNQYLSVDPSSEWANEARRHLSRLAATLTFGDILRRDYARLQNDPTASRSLAQQFPQQARVWGETRILASWAEAQLAGHTAEAENHLHLAGFFGDALRERSGERMLAEAVAAIERTDAASRNRLAHGHIFFRDAQKAYRDKKLAVAEAMFTDAADAFDSGKSPLALESRYFVANTIFDQGRIDEARARLQELDGDRHPGFFAYHAQLGWELGLAYSSIGRWGETLRTFHHSVSEFDRLGETQNAMNVRELLAEAYERIGDPHTAWKHRIAALREIGKAEGERLQVTLDAIAQAAAMDEQWPVATSFFTLELAMARRSGDNFRIAQLLVMRARSADRQNDAASASGDLAAAERVISAIPDRALRERAAADCVTAAAYLTRNPTIAVPLLNQAIAYHHGQGRSMFLPDLYLHRSRARQTLRNFAAASADIDAGIAELERQRTSLVGGDERWGVFGTAGELFDDAVVLALDRGDVRRAFQYLERARARQLLESLGAPLPGDLVRDLPRDVVLIEYASLPARLIIFIADDQRLTVVSRDTSRTTLQEAVARFARGMSAHDAARLYDLIVAPVANDLPPGRTLIVVPDPLLRSVPFAALMTPSGRYLIEERAVVVAPSAAVFARLAATRTPSQVRPRLLLIAGPPAGDGSFAVLSAEQREVSDIAAAYGNLATIGLKKADRASFQRNAAAAEVIHFVGHATSDTDREGALVLSSSAGPAGRLDARNIATMSLGRTRVVVLAACGSARGEERAGEGTISVARAFLAAGVPSVIATLTPIEDAAAADFFPRIHRHLASGVPPAEALRAAQVESIRKHDDPQMWAAVQLLGT